jgi:RHS repeat-associated protein
MTGDGRTDLLWRNVSSGQIVFWEMNGWEIVTTDSVSVTYNGSSWYPQPDVGDFNHDGRDETLWRSSVDGTLVMLETNRGVLVDGSALADSVPSPRSLAPLEPQSSAGGGGGGELALLKMIGRSGMLSQSAETPATDKPWKVLTGLPPYWLAPTGPMPQFAVPPVPHIMAIQPSLRPNGPPRVAPGSPPPWQPRAPNAPTGSVVASTSMQSAASVVEPPNELPVEESAARFTSAPLSGPAQWRYSLYAPELSLLAETNLVATTTTPSIAYEYAWFGGEPLAQFEAAGAGETIRYYFNDHLGAPVLMTSQGGAVQWRVEREPYGRIHSTTTGSSLHQPLSLPGQEYDGTGERAYNVFRWYRTGWGRYTQADPIGLNGDPHVYAYALLNPVRMTDSLGLRGRPTTTPRTPLPRPAPAACPRVTAPPPSSPGLLPFLMGIAIFFDPRPAGEGSMVPEFDPRGCGPCDEDDGPQERCKKKCIRIYEVDYDRCSYAFSGDPRRQALCYEQAARDLRDCLLECEQRFTN